MYDYKQERKERVARAKSLVADASFPDQARRNRVAIELILEEEAHHGFGSCVMQNILKYALTGKDQSTETWAVSEYHVKEINERYTGDGAIMDLDEKARQAHWERVRKFAEDAGLGWDETVPWAVTVGVRGMTVTVDLSAVDPEKFYLATLIGAFNKGVEVSKGTAS